MERTVFGDASGSCLAKVIDIPDVGKVGGLSCWEHIQPLLKYYTFSQGEQVHIAAWPPLDPFIQGSPGFYSMSVEGENGIGSCVSGSTDLCRMSEPVPIIRHRVTVVCPSLHFRVLGSRHRGDENSGQSYNGNSCAG